MSSTTATRAQTGRAAAQALRAMPPDASDAGELPADQRRWPESAKRTAREVFEATGENLAATVRRLERDHGLTVPVTTVRSWVKRPPPSDDAPTVAGTSERLIRLLSSEVRRIERQPSAKMDVDRCLKIAQTLKVLEAIGGKGKAQGRGLLDLTGLTEAGEAQPSEAEALLMSRGDITSSDAPSEAV